MLSSPLKSKAVRIDTNHRREERGRWSLPTPGSAGRCGAGKIRGCSSAAAATPPTTTRRASSTSRSCGRECRGRGSCSSTWSRLARCRAWSGCGPRPTSGSPATPCRRAFRSPTGSPAGRCSPRRASSTPATASRWWQPRPSTRPTTPWRRCSSSSSRWGRTGRRQGR